MNACEIVIILIAVASIALGYYVKLQHLVGSTISLAVGLLTCIVAGNWAVKIGQELYPQWADLYMASGAIDVMSRITLFLLIYSAAQVVSTFVPALKNSVWRKLGENKDRWLGAATCFVHAMTAQSIVLNVLLVTTPAVRDATLNPSLYGLVLRVGIDFFPAFALAEHYIF